MKILNIIIYTLFVTRISYMFVHEKGPNGIFEKMRSYFEVYTDSEGNIVTTENGNILQGILSCFYCFSMYPSIFITVLHIINKNVSFYISLFFSLSQLAIIIYNKLM